jgi:hypothetical protein
MISGELTNGKSLRGHNWLICLNDLNAFTVAAGMPAGKSKIALVRGLRWISHPCPKGCTSSVINQHCRH